MLTLNCSGTETKNSTFNFSALSASHNHEHRNITISTLIISEMFLTRDCNLKI